MTLDSFAATASEELLHLAVRATMGRLLAEDAAHPSAALRAAEATAYIVALARVRDEGSLTVRREVERRAEGRIKAAEAESDPTVAEAEALSARPAVADQLTWREAEVLRELAKARNEVSQRANVIPVVRADYLIARLQGRVPKTVVRQALRRLQDLDLVYQRQFGTTVHYEPSLVGFEVAGEEKVESVYWASQRAKLAHERSAAKDLAELAERAARAKFDQLAHERAQDARALVEAAMANAYAQALQVAAGLQEAEATSLVQAQLDALSAKERARDERYAVEHLKRTVIDAEDQLLPRECEVLRQLVADANGSVRSWNRTMEEAGNEEILGRRIRDLRVVPSVTSEALALELQGRLSRWAVKQALTRLRELNLVRYDLDAIAGQGTWRALPSAFQALKVDRAAFDEYR